MGIESPVWDYLILTASNERQASAYSSLLARRRLDRVRRTMVVPDLEGKRIGSGGSTVVCLREVLATEQRAGESAAATLGRLRILIVHAGGDSRRLPAYGPCGKIFLPVPAGEGQTLFDLLVPEFLELPAGAGGQVVVTAGDALLKLDMSAVRFDRPGITGVGSWEEPADAARHGVFVEGEPNAVRLYLQKPGVEEQQAAGAVRAGKTILDAGVLSFDGAAAAALVRAFPGTQTMLEKGVDIYREVCCALGSDATAEHFVKSAQGSGSAWTEGELRELFPALSGIPFWIQVSPRCEFLHFGSTRQLIESGRALSGRSLMVMNSAVSAEIAGEESWVEGCRIGAPVKLGGRNVLVGVEVNEPLEMPAGACVDVLSGEGGWFIRCYGVDDDFKKPAAKGGRFCGRPMLEWIAAVGGSAEDFWSGAGERSLWNARVFPVEARPEHAKYLWMFDVERAGGGQKRAYLAAERRSAEEIALLSDQDAFHARRWVEPRTTMLGSTMSERGR
ncbi:MAG: hypothetical protein HY821_07900 [Acidobacteria bacterium]|nr:hypothetical protein [Acidobacteriota bacterium]